MTTPNDREPPKKPLPPGVKPPVTGAKPAGQPSSQPPGQPSGQGAKPPVTGAKPATESTGQGAKPAGAPPAQGAKPAGPPTTPGAKPAQPPAQGAKPAQPPAPGAKPAQPPAQGAKPAQPAQPGQGIKPPPKPVPRPTSGAATPAKPATPGAAPPKPATSGAAPAKPALPPASGQTTAKVPPPGKPTPPPAPKKPTEAVTKKPAPAPKKKDAASSGGRRKIGQVLVDLGFLDEDQLYDVLEEARNNGQLTGQAAVARGLITADQLLQGLGEQAGLKVVNIDDLKPTPESIALLPDTMASVYKVLPLSYKDKVLTVVTSDPNNMAGMDDLRGLLGVNEIHVHLTSPDKFPDALTRFYAGKEESIVDLISAMEKDENIGKFSSRKESSIDLAELTEVADSAPVRKLINMVFLLAIRDKASDIHFEPFEDEYKMRYRCDGVLYEMVPPPRHLAAAISSRIKVMSNLDISERRMPQDGRIELNIGGNQVDMRVSILPTMFGESCVIRVLDRSVVSLDLNKIGMTPTLLEQFRYLINKPNGIVLVTGPTGAGKTTTLYSALNELNVITDKVITTEDPIEYDIEGIVQCQINSEIGMTFASALRSILRQDPDKILVGEIRDLETAQIAIQASLTGHTVFSTLHTNDAPSTITRLRDMGVEPFLLTATLEGVLAQRLVRKICVDCRTDFEPSPDLLMELNLRPQDVVGKKFFYGRGCDRCNNTGHKSRTGLYELITVNDDIRDLISKGVSTDELRNECRKLGMTTLRESGLEAIFGGHTTIEEVVRETVMEDM